MATKKTPDVYVEEISTLPPSVAEVGTAIPAFIGYSEKATKNTAGDLLRKPTKIYSLKEFESLFGYPAAPKISIAIERDDAGRYKVKSLTEPAIVYMLYYAVKMFFDNGGAQCYVVSVDTYNTTTPTVGLGETKDKARTYGLSDGLDAVAMEDEPTLLVIPEAVRLTHADYLTLTQAMLKQCDDLRDRFAIFDVWKGDTPQGDEVVVNETTSEKKNVITASREAWAGTLKYGAAYYPFLKTTMNYNVQEKADNTSNVTVMVGADTTGVDLAKFNKVGDTSFDTTIYNFVKSALKDFFITMPPSGAMAGIYAATDAARGVWKAPANVPVIGVIEPAVRIDNLHQEDLNVDATAGKSINAIRAFSGKGTMVWGARTLAGNDNEWRYISVRRFYNMVEESVKKSTYWAVFEPNDANTWVKVRGMIENYLIDKWREGALAGATPKDALFVKCGLGTTMSAQDILEGRMNVEIGMAVVRPAEFIILKFSHKLQTS